MTPLESFRLLDGGWQANVLSILWTDWASSSEEQHKMRTFPDFINILQDRWEAFVGQM